MMRMQVVGQARAMPGVPAEHKPMRRCGIKGATAPLAEFLGRKSWRELYQAGFSVRIT